MPADGSDVDEDEEASEAISSEPVSSSRKGSSSKASSSSKKLSASHDDDGVSESSKASNASSSKMVAASKGKDAVSVSSKTKVAPPLQTSSGTHDSSVQSGSSSSSSSSSGSSSSFGDEEGGESEIESREAASDREITTRDPQEAEMSRSDYLDAGTRSGEEEPLLGSEDAAKRSSLAGSFFGSMADSTFKTASSIHKSDYTMDSPRTQIVKRFGRCFSILLILGLIGFGLWKLWSVRQAIFEWIKRRFPPSCVFSEWSDWTECSQTCGVASSRSRRTFSPKKCRPIPASSELARSRPCEIVECGGKNCEVSQWRPWGLCSQPCGRGVRLRERSPAVVPTAGGLRCPPLVQMGSCKASECSLHCKTSQWTAWTPCSKTCGKGQMFRQRTVIAGGEGIACPHVLERAECDSGPCGSECIFHVVPLVEHALDLAKCNGTGSRDVCHFTCSDGYEEEQPLRCIEGIFIMSECVRTFCKSKPRVENAVNLRSCRGYPSGSVCHVVCLEGYKKSDDVYCRGGEWTTAVCEEITCDQPPNIEHSVGALSVCSGLKSGQVCSQFSCKEGYEKSEELVCTVGNFNFPKCIERPCSFDFPQIKDATPASNRCADRYSPGDTIPSRSICPVTCRDRFHQTGDTICLRGKWVPASCLPKHASCWRHATGCSARCLHSELPANYTGPDLCANATSGDTCILSCPGEYDKIGDFLCVDGRWVSAGCRRPGCPESPDLEGSGNLFSCRGASDGQRCKLICASGYHPSGPSLRCHRGMWEGATCLELRCLAPPKVRNAVGDYSSCSGLRPGEFCPLECEDGYSASPPAGFECLLGGHYAATACEPKSCPITPRVAGSGDLSACAGAAGGSFCTVVCAQHFLKVGDVYCDRGHWTESSCSPSQACGEPPDIPYAVTENLQDCIDTRDQHACLHFQCLPGYAPSGPLLCKNGHFTRPTCEPARCTVEPVIRHAAIGFSCGDLESGGVCHLQCEAGYDKTSDILCWQGEFSQASCEPVTASRGVEREALSVSLRIPTSFSNVVQLHRGGVLGSHLIHLLALAGDIQPHRLIDRGLHPRTLDTSAVDIDVLAGGGEASISARRAVHQMQEALLSSVAPLHVFLQRFVASDDAPGEISITRSTIGRSCEKAPVLENSEQLAMCIDTLSGGTCPVRCKEGFTSRGELMCLNGEWSGSSCIPEFCGIVPVIDHAESLQHCANTASGSYCNLECAPGYLKTHNLECRDGLFLPAACLPKPCIHEPIVPRSGGVSFAHCANMNSGQDCVLRCARGLLPDRRGVYRCERGNWRRLGSCTLADCFYQPLVLNSASEFFGCFGTRHGSDCPFSCQEGFDMTGKLTCKNGEFTAARCAPKRCIEVPYIPGLQRELVAHCSPMSSGKICKVKCSPGLKLSMPLLCTLGSWTKAECIPVAKKLNSCEQAPTISRVVDVFHCIGTRPNEKCNVKCDPGYRLNGTLLCSDGYWTPVICEPLPCKSAPMRKNSIGMSTCANRPHGAACFLWCRPGYSAGGHRSIIPERLSDQNLSVAIRNSLLICIAGQWEGPECIEAPCDSGPPHIPNAIHLDRCAGTPSGHSCRIECVSGFYAEAFPRCIRGAWVLQKAVHCMEAPCLNVPHVAHALNLNTCVNRRSREQCPLECEAGFEPSGQLLCVEGVWQHAECTGYCRHIPQGITKAADLSHCRGTVVGGSCPLLCQAGFRPSGRIRCLADRTWDPAFCYEVAEALSLAVVVQFEISGLHVSKAPHIETVWQATGQENLGQMAASFRATSAKLLSVALDLVAVDLRLKDRTSKIYELGIRTLCKECESLLQRCEEAFSSGFARNLRDGLCFDLCDGSTDNCRSRCRLMQRLQILKRRHAWLAGRNTTDVRDSQSVDVLWS